MSEIVKIENEIKTKIREKISLIRKKFGLDLKPASNPESLDALVYVLRRSMEDGPRPLWLQQLLTFHCERIRLEIWTLSHYVKRKDLEGLKRLRDAIAAGITRLQAR